MPRLQLCLLLAAFAGLAAAVDMQSCSWSSIPGTSFDLSSLRHKGATAPWQVTDGDIPCTDKKEKTYTYVFNVCADVNKVPAKCHNKQAPVLQWDPEDDTVDCVNAGTLGSASFSLISDEDPSQGVKLEYADGAMCTHNATGAVVPTPRTTTLIFRCSDNVVPQPVYAREPQHCQYTIEMDSQAGCPTQCPIAGRKLCGGHGLCAYDRSNKKSRCFCDEGFSGDDCMGGAAANGTSGAILGLLIVLLLLSVGLVAVVVYLVRAINEYRRDQNNYAALHESETELMPADV